MPNRESPKVIGVKTRLNTQARLSGLHQAHASQLIYLAYMQEAFLRRMAQSAFADAFILTGGALLLRMAPGFKEVRPSKDLDLLCRLHERTPERLQAAFATILQVTGEEDAVEFDPHVSRIEPLLTAGPAGGWGVEITGWLGRSHLTLKMDVVWEPLPEIEPESRAFPTLLNSELHLPPILTYPLEALLADKVASWMERGERNTRSKDLLDIVLLARTRDFEGTLLEVALRATCAWQGTPFSPGAAIFSSETLASHPEQVQLWQQFLVRARLTFPPPTLAEAIELVRRLYRPVVTGEARGKVWRHSLGQWES